MRRILLTYNTERVHTIIQFHSVFGSFIIYRERQGYTYTVGPRYNEVVGGVHNPSTALWEDLEARQSTREVGDNRDSTYSPRFSPSLKIT